MSQTALERRHFPVPMRWLHAGNDPSRPGQRGRRAVRSLIRFKRLGLDPDVDQAAQLMSPRYERPFSASSRWISRCARIVPECALYGFSPARERCGHDFNLNKINKDIAQLGMKVIEVSAGEYMVLYPKVLGREDTLSD